MKAGPGTNVADVNASGVVDTVDIGQIDPLSTGTGQFIIRGDGIGTHNVDVDFAGFITGPGFPEPFPVGGSARTSVEVYGPPELDVVVRHPSRSDGPDVTVGEIYTLMVDITNRSSRPALYTSLDLFIGGNAELVDEDGNVIPGSHRLHDIGIIPPGRTARASFRVRALVEGDIIACQAIAGGNISLNVDTGPAGAACALANTCRPTYRRPCSASIRVTANPTSYSPVPSSRC